MSEEIINSLDELQPESGKWLSNALITGITQSLTQRRYNLMRLTGRATDPTYGLVGSTQSLRDPANRSSRRRMMILQPGREDNFTFMLNTGLLGGTSYPILTAALGTAAGFASGGAGLLFTVVTTGLSVNQTAQRVLARGGDEIWQVEEIGKARESSWFGKGEMEAVHVGSYFLVDPYRQRVGGPHAKGWLIHEERHVLTL